MLTGIISFSRFELQKLRIDICEQLLLDCLTEKAAMEGIDYGILFDRLQVTPKPL